MPLVDLKTNLRSLKYGMDRPGGDSSRQPFVTKTIPGNKDKELYSAIGDTSEYEGNSPDFILRNGLLNIQDSAQDVKRIVKWFTTPIGLAFIAKQNVLARQESAPPKAANPLQVGDLSILNRFFNPATPVLQAGVLSLGYHLNGKGVNPFARTFAANNGEKSGGYFNVTLSNNNADSENGGKSRLTLLYKTKILGDLTDSNAKRLYNISILDEDALFKYSGGPNADVPGISDTRIRIAGINGSTRDRVINNIVASNAKFNVNILSNNDKLTNGNYIKGANSKNPSTLLLGLNDIYNKNLEAFNRELTYGTSLLQQNTIQKLTGSFIDANGVSITTDDGINVLEPTNTARQEDKNSDLIKFFFERVDPTVTNNTQNEFLFFRAYVNSITDNFKADWTPYKYVGRAENFYKYGGFGRDVQLSFVIYAHTEPEMIPLYNKLNRLLGTTAPTYSDAGLMLGNFVRITVGDYFNNMPSIINSINLTPSFEAGWEINRNPNSTIKTGSLEENVGQIPKMIEVSLGFTPLHNFTPKYGEDFIREKVN